MVVTREVEISGRAVTVKVDEYDGTLHHVGTQGWTSVDRNFPEVDGCWFSSFANLHAAKYGEARLRRRNPRRARPSRRVQPEGIKTGV